MVAVAALAAGGVVATGVIYVALLEVRQSIVAACAILVILSVVAIAVVEAQSSRLNALMGGDSTIRAITLFDAAQAEYNRSLEENARKINLEAWAENEWNRIRCETENLERRFSELQREGATHYEKMKDATAELEQKRNEFESEQLERWQQFGTKLLRVTEWFWSNLDPNQFEKEVAEVFRLMGCKAEVSRVGADGGIDIVVERDGKTAFVQCKRQDKAVGPHVARELYGVMTAAGITSGYLVSASGFTTETTRFATSNGIALVGVDLLVEMSAEQLGVQRRNVRMHWENAESLLF